MQNNPEPEILFFILTRDYKKFIQLFLHISKERKFCMGKFISKKKNFHLSRMYNLITKGYIRNYKTRERYQIKKGQV